MAPPHTGRTGVAAATFAFCVVFVAGAVPIPLYGIYRAENGITTDQVALASVVFFTCAILTLLCLARLSDHLGRKPLAFAALGVAAIGCVAFFFVDGPAPLMFARGLQGIAAGLVSSAVAAYVVDTSSRAPRWVAPTVTGIGATIGLTVGAVGSGLLADLAPAPRVLPCAASLMLLIVAAVLIARAPETTVRTQGALASLRPQLRLPHAARRPFVAAGSVLVATWALGGYYQSFGSSITRDELHSSSAFVAAAVFSSYMATAVLGGPIGERLSPRAAQRTGIAVVAAAAVGLAAAIAVHSVVVFIVIGAIAGVAQGVASSGSMRTLLPHASPGERAGLLAVVYATSYAGAAVTSLVAGQLTRTLPLLDITLGYAALAGVALVVTLLPISRERDPDAARARLTGDAPAASIESKGRTTG
jgi:MFS family permease